MARTSEELKADSRAALAKGKAKKAAKLWAKALKVEEARKGQKAEEKAESWAAKDVDKSGGVSFGEWWKTIGDKRWSGAKLGSDPEGVSWGAAGGIEDAPPQFDLLDKLISLRDRYAAASTGGGGYSGFFTGADARAGRGPISGPKPAGAPTVVPPSVGEPTGVSGPRAVIAGRRKSRRFKNTPLGIPPRGAL